MKSNTQHAMERKMLDQLHVDCKSWRRVASECVHAEAFIPASTAEQYRIVHGRILAKCRNLADEELVPESRRHIAMQLNELLRPWPSAQSLKEAPTNIVSDLVKSQMMLDEQLSGRRGLVPGPIGRMLLTALIAAAIGIAFAVLLQWSTSNVATLLQPVHSWVASIVTYISQTTFTERFAVAVLLSFGLGTWMLSRLSPS